MTESTDKPTDSSTLKETPVEKKPEEPQTNSTEPSSSQTSQGKKRSRDELEDSKGDNESDKKESETKTTVPETKEDNTQSDEKKENEKDETTTEEAESKATSTTSTPSTKTTTKSDEPSKEDEKPPAKKPKFVFGSSTTFGQTSAFGLIDPSKSVFGSSSKSVFGGSSSSPAKPITETESSKESSTKSKTPVFGSGVTFGSSSFANAFQNTLKKESIFDKPKSDTDDKTKDSESGKSKDTDGSNNNGPKKEVYQKVHLQKQETHSGEENETTVFQVKAKLYHMEVDKIQEGWKERGVGVIKVNKFVKLPEGEKQHYTARLVMRQDGILKLILNVPIVKGFKVYKGMASSLSSDKFLRFQGIEEGKPVHYALKIGQVENAATLQKHIEDCIPE
ncbi:unnamed protein product [Ambrosiozyma monospora]|uniref:Unnamed protein product n=1 Tax=Ambrosiozyma monospora TaxID=43982 RepID=A0ACB5T776_AMBMO|nr:unnamed protein product [Ambrosiozyma monospora]